MHGKQAVSPIADEKDPASQTEHTADPENAEYLPTSHFWHVLELLDPLVLDDVPVEHKVQSLEPAELENVPVPQMRQVAKLLAAEADENVPAWQLIQLVLPDVV